ncbi:MAG: tRNA 5-methoxyuridine(34)/uridine 5-oxyacetic acid(34) synthase CmoB [Gammaproteobacteria bacterium]|nr:tRNA 5-methoxyuridine(34)/uridine 5-oxyacetic acid(34) synthase CmoB [Gammaproteobacteria bacterium]
MSYVGLYQELTAAGFAQWVDVLRQQESDWLVHHGDFPRWNQALSNLPVIENTAGHFDRTAVTVEGNSDQKQLNRALKGLSPWRKGPYQISDTYIDTEWRSDFKWDRLQPHLKPLTNKRVLDIGCGNGYHCWRMIAENPKLVLGIEPSVLFNLQFRAIQQYLNRPEIHLLPLGIEAMPDDMNWFDTVFSMGVLYHRKSPIDHLYQLKSLLRPGGELCLETLVIEGQQGDMLLPKDRYARMRNVWFIPSADELKNWLERCGFIDVRIVDTSVTTVDEQRSTEWMQFESLVDCLDPVDHRQTVEGLPAPRRSILLAEKPN